MIWQTCKINNTMTFSNKTICYKSNKCNKILILCKLSNWPNNSFHNNQSETFNPKEWWEETWWHLFWIQIHSSSSNHQTLMLIACQTFPIIVLWVANRPISIRTNVKSCVKWSLVLSNSPKHNHSTTSWKCRKKIYKTIIEIWKLQITSPRMRIHDSKPSFNKFRKNSTIEIKS